MVNVKSASAMATAHNLPGNLTIERSRSGVRVELDLPARQDRLGETLVPGVEAMVIGFLQRLSQRRGSGVRDVGVVASTDHILAWVLPEDLDHFLVSLAALFQGRAHVG